MNDLKTNIEKQIAAVRKEQHLLFKQTAERFLVLKNIENFLQSIIDKGENLASGQETTISIPFEAISTHAQRGDPNYEGIFIDDSSLNSVTLLATDGSRDDNSRKPTAAIAAAFNRNSPLNIAVPSQYFSSTEVLEIQASILGLNQCVKNNISRIHITIDNLSALKFLKQTIMLSKTTSKYLREKMQK